MFKIILLAFAVFAKPAYSELIVVLAMSIVEITFPEVNRNFYTDYSIKRMDKLTKRQEVAYERWKK